MRRNEAIAYVTKADFKNVVNFSDGTNPQIIDTLHKNIARAVSQTRDIAKHFKGASDLETSRNIWNFLKTQIRYKKDPVGRQDIKLPSRFLADGTGDCKSYSLFTAAILYNLGIPFIIRYASYSNDPTPQHVYVVLQDGTIIDAVWIKFNDQKPYTYKQDYTMKIQTLSGVGCINCAKPVSGANSVMLGVGSIGKIGLKKAAKSLVTAVKKTASKAQTATKNTAVVKKAAKLQTAAKNTAVIKTAAKLQNEIKKGGVKSVALAAPRRAYRTLVAVNFRGWASKLASNITEAKSIWAKAGGSWPELEKSINIGKKKKPLFGSKNQQINQSVSGIGVAAETVGSLLALAAPLILLFKSLTKDDGGAQDVPGADAADNSSSGNPLTDIVDSVTNIIKSATGKTDPSTEQNSGSGSTPPDTDSGSSKTSNMLLLGAAALGAYLIFK